MVLSTSDDGRRKANAHYELLLGKIDAGDTDALDELLRRLEPRIKKAILPFPFLRDEVEDVVQETLLKLWQNLGSYRRGTDFAAWVRRSSRNMAINHLRSRNYSKGREEIPASQTSYDGDLGECIDNPPLHDRLLDVFSLISTREYAELFGEMILTLSPRQAEVVAGHLSGNTQQEDADQLNVPNGTIMSNRSRSAGKLHMMVDGLKTEDPRVAELSAAWTSRTMRSLDFCRTVVDYLSKRPGSPTYQPESL